MSGESIRHKEMLISMDGHKSEGKTVLDAA
ncbi:hypothetical protein ES705_03123 [subsurface metagenome]